ncbi:MAG: methyltransferase domain-containing protein, partial [bacterium]|nr:methyltransferase domain-containing protein [bacterium]
MKKTFKLIPIFLVVLMTGLGAHDRDFWQKPEKVLRIIGVKPGMVIGEPGAGKGYFTFKLARKVGPSGKIYANDIVDSKLDTIKTVAREKGLDNIITIKGKVDDPLFPEGTLDMAFM